MARKKDSDEETIERLEKENRELKQLNRSLLKRLRKISKGINEEEFEEAEAEVKVKRSTKTFAEDDCTNCGKGRLVMIDFGARKQIGCNNPTCNWRGKFLKK